MTNSEIFTCRLRVSGEDKQEIHKALRANLLHIYIKIVEGMKSDTIKTVEGTNEIEGSFKIEKV